MKNNIVYMVEFDWSVENDCNVETELFFDYNKALERYDELIANELDPNLSWVGDLAIKPNGCINKGYTLEQYGDRTKKENLYWHCTMDDYYMYHSIIQLKQLEIK